MPDIDPAALSRSDSLTNGPIIPSGASKQAPASSLGPTKPSKAVQSAPRAELETIYTTLKTTIGEQWTRYKEAVSQFILGHLSHNELLRQIDDIIAEDVHREHLHNQLISTIHANIFRDAPEQGVASWVSTNEKPTTLAKPVSGDAAKQRLKYETMQMSRAYRERLKTVQDDSLGPVSHSMKLHTESKRLYNNAGTSAQLSGSNAAASSQASSSTSLNKDLEIRRRYNQPLSSETHDLPNPSSLADRVLPICYEEGLSGGAAGSGSCAELLSTAVELFVKEVLTALLGRTRIDSSKTGSENTLNGISVGSESYGNDLRTNDLQNSTSDSHSVMSINQDHVISKSISSYKTQINSEVSLASSQLNQAQATSLPGEQTSANTSRSNRGNHGDLQIAWELGDAWLGGMMPWIGEQRMSLSHDLITVEDRVSLGLEVTRSDESNQDGNAMDLDSIGNDIFVYNESEEFSGSGSSAYVWQGASKRDRSLLNNLLDDCIMAGH